MSRETVLKQMQALVDDFRESTVWEMKPAPAIDISPHPKECPFPAGSWPERWYRLTGRLPPVTKCKASSHVSWKFSLDGEQAGTEKIYNAMLKSKRAND